MAKHIWLLFSLATILLIYSASTTSLSKIEPNAPLGLASMLPLTFWAGMILLACLWYVSRNSRRWQTAALVLTVSFLYVVPAIIRTPVWLSASYYPFGESTLIDKTGHLVLRPDSILVSYQSWPGFLYLASMITLFTGLPDYLLLKLFPIIIIALYGLLTFLILRLTLKTSNATIGAAWLLGSFFLRQYYFGPAPIEYALFLLGFFVIAKLYFSDGLPAHARALEALFLVIFTVVTFSHALTSLMLLAVLVSVYFSQRLVHWSSSTANIHTITRLCLLAATILLAYTVYVASTFLKVAVSLFSRIFSGRVLLGIYREPSRVSGSLANRVSYYSYWSILALNVIVAGVAIVQVLRLVRSHRKPPNLGYSFFCIILLLFMGLFAFSAQYGSSEASQRAFMFGLIPLTYLGVHLLANKPKIVVAIVIVFLFLNIPAQYGGDSYTLATSSELAGARFLASFAAQHTTCFGENSFYVRYYDPATSISFLTLGTPPFTTFPNSSTINEKMQASDYIVVSENQNNYYIYFLSKTPFGTVDLSRLDRVYDSGSFFTFMHPNMTSQP